MDKRCDAIRKCGAEIVKLRKHIEDIDQERCRLHSQLKTLHRTTAEAEMVTDLTFIHLGRMMKAFRSYRVCQARTESSLSSKSGWRRQSSTVSEKPEQSIFRATASLGSIFPKGVH